MGASYREAIATIERRPTGRRTKLSIYILRHDRCVVVVGETSNVGIALRLLGRNCLMARQTGLTAAIARVMLKSGIPGVERHAAWLLALQAHAGGDPAGQSHRRCPDPAAGL